jgi:hypothetical protein
MGQRSRIVKRMQENAFSPRSKKSIPKLPLIIVADSLYSTQPMIETIVSQGMHYVLVAKPDDHKMLREWVNEMRTLNEVMHMEFTDQKGKTHVYEWINGVPLNGNKDAPIVSYFEYWMKDTNKRVYHSSWVTDLRLDDDCIEEMVRIGRSRWMVENDVFNNIKNHGYHIEHNYDHGVKNLSMNFFLLNMRAFFVHQILELADPVYQWLQKKLGSKKNLWDHLRMFYHMIVFADWKDLAMRSATEYGYS